MSRPEISDKLKTFLDTQLPFDHERDVVYFMVEIRKVIDLDNSAKMFPLLKFYSDWIVHSRKDYITSEIEDMMKKMYDHAVKIISSPMTIEADSPMMEFAYMKELRKEMRAFLRAHGIDTALSDHDDPWISFISPLIKVLENQPIVNPIPEVVQFLFTPANTGCVEGVINFTNPIGKHDHFVFKNAY